VTAGSRSCHRTIAGGPAPVLSTRGWWELEQIQFLAGPPSRWRRRSGTGCKQRLRGAVNDHMGWNRSRDGCRAILRNPHISFPIAIGTRPRRQLQFATVCAVVPVGPVIFSRAARRYHQRSE